VTLRTLVVAVAALALAAGSASARAPSVDAESWLVENPVTGEVLLHHHDREKLPIASITKLMTVLIVLEHEKLDDVVTVPAAAAKVGESTIGLIAGQQITVHDLLAASLIQSANDAADALAISVAGSIPGFVALMNEKAAELGLTDTHFVRPDGLDAVGHYSSARDVAALARLAMKSPVVAQLVRERSATLADGEVLHTWNDLLGRFPGVYGVKTGHTDRAGWCEVAAVAGRGYTIYAVILGSPSRARRNVDLEQLLAYGLAQYRSVDAVDSSRVYATLPTGFGRAALDLVAAAPLTRIVRVGHPLVERVIVPAHLVVPVRKGQQLGSVQVFSDGRLVGSRPLVAARDVDRAGLLTRSGWYAGRTVRRLWGWVP
jgi:D-alanyl-D-alanine carboxypeptidase (penicillin-binding protein 5/6)